MWRHYAADYLKNNRAGGSSVMAASFIAAFFLSLLCSLFYNFWLDSIEGAKQEDGGWHGRITAELEENDLEEIRAFDNVEKVTVDLSGEAVGADTAGGQRRTADIYFYDKRTVYEDMQEILTSLGLPSDAADYNYQLLSLYFVRIPGDEMPRLLMPMYLAVIALVCLSLILVIHNSFALSMNNRVHQFGIFSSIGATPRQIRVCLLQEAFALSAVPAAAGILSGILCSFGIVRAVGDFAEELAGGRKMDFTYHPAVLALIVLFTFFTVYVSARIPAGKLSRLTPLEAVKGTGELQLRKKRRTPVLSLLFGAEGDLAGAALRAQRKAFRTTTLSLTFAFWGFMLMQCFFTLSGISTRHTYFEAYQDAWDVMVTVRDARIEEFEQVQALQELAGAESCAVYQKGVAVSVIPKGALSLELVAAGGLEKLAGISLSAEENAYLVETRFVILDDRSFEAYCGQNGVKAGAGEEGAIVLNRIWNSAESNFRYPEYIPYIKEGTEKIVVRGIEAGTESSGPGMERTGGMSADGSEETTADGSKKLVDESKESADESKKSAANIPGEDKAEISAGMRGKAVVEVPVLACTEEAPVLREEYGKSEYPLVQFISLSYWRETFAQIGGAEKNVYIRVLAGDRESPEALEALEDSAVRLTGGSYEVESENRIQEKKDNDTMIRGYELILGGLCVLLAVIGIAHVFSNTAGFLRQRRREFARYISVGLTPGGVRKMFCIEAAVIVGRPLCITLFLTVVAAAGMIRASCLDPMEFIREAPVLPILVFVLTVFGFTALAYWIGGRRILRMDPAESLRDDTMM